MSKIERTEKTWNPVVGCSKVSPGCLNCYAERMACRLAGMGRKGYNDGVLTAEGKWTGKIQCIEKALEIPLHWKTPRMIFVCSMSDLFHPSVPFEFIDKVWWTMSVCREHTFQVLTKRPERYLEYWQYRLSKGFTDGNRENIWAGVTAENQEMADKRIPILLQIPDAVRFVSIEPLLSAVEDINLDNIDWVIVGGESGPGARPMNPDWARSVRDQCNAAGVPYFMKQMGGFPNKRAKLSEIPEDLRIREYPKIK